MPRTPYENQKHKAKSSRRAADAGRKSYRKRAEDAPTFDSVNPLLLAAIVCLSTTYNASPTFSYTRDGTSLVVAVYYDGERYVDYLSGEEDMMGWFEWLTTDLLPVSDTDMAPYALIASKKP